VLSYEEIKTVSALAGLIIFIVLFALAVAYAFWPGNRSRFERASRIPLEQDPDEKTNGAPNGR